MTIRYTKNMKNNSPAGRFGDRVRFNWGFHDGAADQRTGHVALWNRGPAPTHFDRVYLDGYHAGRDAVKAGAAIESSESAWRER